MTASIEGSFEVLPLVADVRLKRFELQVAFAETLQHDIERSLKIFKNRSDEARCHDSTSSNRNLRPPVRVNIVSSCAAISAIPC